MLKKQVVTTHKDFENMYVKRNPDFVGVFYLREVI